MSGQDMPEVTVDGITFRVGEMVRVGGYAGELIEIHGPTLCSVDLGQAYDDGYNDGFALVNPVLLKKL